MRKLLVIVVASFALAGCKSKCRQLSEKLCDCTVNSTDKTACLQVASTNETYNAPTDADNEVCAALYEQCNCRLIDTAIGKAKCGLARPLAGVDAGL
jgi:uncharacterized protein YcfL